MNPKLAHSLVADELFDLTLYKELSRVSAPGPRKILEELIPIEQKHHAFWENFTGVKVKNLDMPQRIKLRLLVLACRLFRSTGIHLVLEAIEIYGIRKYLDIWETNKNAPLGEAVKEILADELKHEDQIVSQLTQRKINPERIRSIFLGLNDGLVEILGAVSGFFAAFNEPSAILIASSTVAAAGAFSMAAGAFVAATSEREVKRIDAAKERFLDPDAKPQDDGENPLATGAIVGASYLVGAIIPVMPVLLGAKNVLASLASSACMVALISYILAFLSGMNIKRRIAVNFVILATAVGVTYVIGLGVKSIWGISV
ncbi:MAG: VIT1/CCC1 transporter family protein [Elusimicrobiota bacterium]